MFSMAVVKPPRVEALKRLTSEGFLHEQRGSTLRRARPRFILNLRRGLT